MLIASPIHEDSLGTWHCPSCNNQLLYVNMENWMDRKCLLFIWLKTTIAVLIIKVVMFHALCFLIGSWQEYFWIQRIWILLQEETQRWQLHYWLDPAHLEEMVFTNYVRNQTILNNCNIDVFFHISCSSNNFPCCFYLELLLVESCSSSDMICNWFLMCTLHFFVLDRCSLHVVFLLVFSEGSWRWSKSFKTGYPDVWRGSSIIP